MQPRGRPIVKWAGGKSDLAPRIATAAVHYLAESDGMYVEPFLGGGAVALELGATNSNLRKRMFLADLAEPLIDAYEVVVQDPKGVWGWINQLFATGSDREAYKQQVQLYGKPTYDPALLAARFLYLNACCFNGLWRVNSKGEFNVPFGGKKDEPVVFPARLCLGHLVEFSEVLAGATLRTQSFETTLDHVHPGDFVFADPPYYGAFDGYTAEGFAADKQAALADRLRQLSEAGVGVVCCNSDCEAVRELFSWATVIPVGERRRINRDLSGRGEVGCVLLCSPEMTV